MYKSEKNLLFLTYLNNSNNFYSSELKYCYFNMQNLIGKSKKKYPFQCDRGRQGVSNLRDVICE